MDRPDESIIFYSFFLFLYHVVDHLQTSYLASRWTPRIKQELEIRRKNCHQRLCSVLCFAVLHFVLHCFVSFCCPVSFIFFAVKKPSKGQKDKRKLCSASLFYHNKGSNSRTKEIKRQKNRLSIALI